MSLLSARCADGSPVCAVAVGFRLNAIGSENAGKTSLRPKYREMLDVSCTDLYNDIIVIYHYYMTMSFYIDQWSLGSALRVGKTKHIIREWCIIIYECSLIFDQVH